MKRLIALTLIAGALFTCAACEGNTAQSIAASEAETTSAEVTAVTENETEAAASIATNGNWEGRWEAETGEYFEIYDVTETSFKCRFFHYEEGQIEQFDYDMEFDNDTRTVASETGSADDHGGWEYAFALEGYTITVTWQENEQKYAKTK